MLTLHKTLTHVEPKLFVGSFVVCAIGSCAYLAKNSGMGELDISGKKVCRVHPRPPWTATSYSLISHIVPRCLHVLHVCMWPSANPVRTAATSPYTGAAGPLRGLGHQHSPHALPALRPGWRGGHAKSACRRVGAIHSAPTHTAAPSGAKRVRRCSGQRSTPTGRGEAPGRACSQLFFRGCVAAPRAARPRQGRHMQSPLLHTAHTLLFHNTKARTPPAPCS